MWVRCPRCSTVIEAKADPLVCTSCGFTANLPSQPATAAPPGYAPPQTYAPPPAFPSGAPAYTQPPYTMAPPAVYGQPPGAYAPRPPLGPRSVGKTRSPAIVIVLGIVTLGVYLLFWAWSITKETDAFVNQPGHSNKKLKTSYILLIPAFALMVLAVVFLVGTMPKTETEVPSNTFFVAIGVLFLALPILVVSTVFYYMALWRVWTTLQSDDRGRGEQNPTNPGLLIALALLGLFVPYIGVVLSMAMLFLTQQALNRTWAAYRPAAVPG